MKQTIEQFFDGGDTNDPTGSAEKKVKDALVFHGVGKDAMEQELGEDPEVNNNFLEHNIKKLLKKIWGISTKAVFVHVYRHV